MILREIMERVHDPVPTGQSSDSLAIGIELLQDRPHGFHLGLDRRMDGALDAGAQLLEDALGRVQFRRIRGLLDERQSGGSSG
jgi:hypothetical protein